MINSLTSQLSEALDKLVVKTEQLQQIRPLGAEQEARLETSFERLNEVVTRLERQQKLESWMALKLEKTVSRLNKALKKQDDATSGAKGEVADNIERLARTVKVVGQAAEIVAGSMEVISKAYRENKTATPNPENEVEKTNTVDLTGTLTHLNNLVKSALEEHSSIDRNKAVSSDPSCNPETEPAGDNEGTQMC